MRVVLMHFHLDTGGVNTVIRQQVETLKALGHDVLILSGRAPKNPWPATVAVLPGLAYDTAAGGDDRGADETAEKIIEAVRCTWPRHRPDLIHVHNPTLAKNGNLQAILKKLQQAGLTLLCQIHDFAEDGRPNAYFKESYLSDCHYAVVNGRDRRILIQCGLTEQGVHFLPNAIRPLAVEQSIPPADAGYVLYPVRAIRRKNIGEAILLQMCAFPSLTLKITLPPSSPSDLPHYRMWRGYAAEHDLPVVFEAGLQGDFRALMAGSGSVLTTSINEGFGFGFLEAWTAEKALWGRLLPDICRDFMDRGVRLDHLYTHLWIPLTWIDAESFRLHWQTLRRQAAERYALSMNDARLEADWRSVAADDLIDFGLLSEPYQRAVLDRVAWDRGACDDLHRINSGWDPFGSAHVGRRQVRENRKAVLEHFSPAVYQRRLTALYEKVCACRVRQHIDKAALCRAFMAPGRFSLLKWGESDV